MASAVLSWLGAVLAAVSSVLVLVLIMGGYGGAFLASPFGVFFSNKTTQDGMLMRQATAELNEEYYARIGQIEQANPHDILEIEASDGVSAIRWEVILSVYAVKVTTDGANGMDVVTEVEVVTEDGDGNEAVEMLKEKPRMEMVYESGWLKLSINTIRRICLRRFGHLSYAQYVFPGCSQ